MSSEIGREAASILRVMVGSSFGLYRIDGSWKLWLEGRDAVRDLGRDLVQPSTVLELLDARLIEVGNNDRKAAVLKLVPSARGKEFVS